MSENLTYWSYFLYLLENKWHKNLEFGDISYNFACTELKMRILVLRRSVFLARECAMLSYVFTR